MISLREYKYWISKNCSRNNCWIVMNNINEMINHDNTIINPSSKDLPLRNHYDELVYVYFAHCEENRIITLIQDKEFYYLIDNSQVETEKGELVPKSVITYNEKLESLVSTLSGSIRKKIGLKPRAKIKLKQNETHQLKGVVPIDFINETHEKQIELFKTYASQNSSILDLSGFLYLDPKVIVDCEDTFTHETITLYQNFKFKNFSWISNFCNLKTLSIWNLNNINDESVKDLNQLSPLLNILEFHECYQISGRIFEYLASHENLEKLIINNEKCELQKYTYETVISDEIWEQLKNSKLSTLVVNSHNLTLDFIDLLLKSYQGIKHFVMGEEILQKLKQNSKDGYYDREDPVSFHSYSNTNIGFQRKKPVRISNLIKNKYGNVFSDSMLKIIKERCPEKSPVVNELIETQKK